MKSLNEDMAGVWESKVFFVRMSVNQKTSALSTCYKTSLIKTSKPQIFGSRQKLAMFQCLALEKWTDFKYWLRIFSVQYLSKSTFSVEMSTGNFFWKVLEFRWIMLRSKNFHPANHLVTFSSAQMIFLILLFTLAKAESNL